MLRSSLVWITLRTLAAGVLLGGSLLVAASGVRAQDTDPRVFSQTGYHVDSDAFWTQR